LDSISVAALEANLGYIFVGLPANLAGIGLIGQEISADSALHHLGPRTRCIEIMGFIAENNGDAIVQCIGSKAMVHDEFCGIVYAAMKATIATDGGLESVHRDASTVLAPKRQAAGAGGFRIRAPEG
jgi:hypothetical protein